jgi:LmbE family N-acetylglucosaminyl deacetylase
MRRRSRLPSVARWLGAPGGERLSGSVAVLSPHLDDAVLSLGAAIAASSGADIAIVTVLAGDPDSDLPAGKWDAGAGFETAGEAARARRREDELACSDVGARPVWLPFADGQYPRNQADDEIWAAVEEALGGAETVLLPGFPLIHDDHAWLLALARREGLPGRRVGLYVEQPYAAARAPRLPAADGWAPLAAALPHRVAKLRACRRYASQLPLLQRGRPVLLPLTRYEAARGGEAVRWS